MQKSAFALVLTVVCACVGCGPDTSVNDLGKSDAAQKEVQDIESRKDPEYSKMMSGQQ